MALKGPSALRRLAVDWILVDGIAEPPALADETIEVLLAARSTAEDMVRADLTVIFGMTCRKDLVAYLVEALDDPVARRAALGQLDLDRRRGGTEPSISGGMTTDEQITAMKRWWKEAASTNPTYKPFVVIRRTESNMLGVSAAKDEADRLSEETLPRGPTSGDDVSSEARREAEDKAGEGSLRGAFESRSDAEGGHAAGLQNERRRQSTDGGDGQLYVAVGFVVLLCICGGSAWLILRRRSVAKGGSRGDG
jgi:hypothetical protein